MRGDANYQRYLVKNGKVELRRNDVRITKPSGGYTTLMRYMADKWFWQVLPNNCATFTREIIARGGGSLRVLLNCPDQEFVAQLQEAARQAVRALPRLPTGPY
jgi:hypothetical protein